MHVLFFDHLKILQFHQPRAPKNALHLQDLVFCLHKVFILDLKLHSVNKMDENIGVP